MKTIDPMRSMMDRIRAGETAGIPSYCTANEAVIKTALKRAAETGNPVLIEATANQVNQYGGYTGMKPSDFYEYVKKMAESFAVTEEQLILAGDHLGPLTWQHLPEKEAMAEAEELVYEFVRAGFTKIHLDTSMKLADDPEGALSPYVVARRGARLYKRCMQAYADLLAEREDAIRPVFVIGSEVPIPGGAQEVESSLAVTRPEDFERTIEAYSKSFAEEGIAEGLDDVIAVVVQPGVEFGDDQVFMYDREAARDLMETGHRYPNYTFEGHSTDYQSAGCLRDMVEDGVGILKVGPALTFAYREALFALSMIENELIPEDERSGFINILDAVMLENPSNWNKHYSGTEQELALARKYSFSDRARYYIGDQRVKDAIDKLYRNLNGCKMPVNIIHMYMPRQAALILEGELKPIPEDLVENAVMQVLLDYEFAAGLNS